jgi:hypothetical protein
MVVDVLERVGPCLSHVLLRHLTGPGVSAQTARKRLSRAIAAGTVQTIEGLNFARNVRFVFLPAQRRKLDFVRRLRDAILESGGAYARAVLAVQARRVVPRWQFHAACGAPLARKKQLTTEQVLGRLRDAGVLIEQEAGALGKVVAMADRGPIIPSSDLAGALARQAAESLLVDMVRDWSRRLGMSSWESTRVRKPVGPLPEVGSFAWDITSPSYLMPLVQWAKGGKKHGFFVCDVLLNGTVTERAASVFRYKCETLRQLNVAPVLALFVADGYQRKAFTDLKDAGIIPATVRSLFGKDAAEAFGDLARVLTDALKGSLDAPLLADAVRRLSKIEGARGNLQGALFEYLVAEIVRSQSANIRIEMNKHVFDSRGKEAEVDVWGFDPPHFFRFIECKGREPGSLVADAEIDRWLDHRVGAVRDHLKAYAERERTSIPSPTFELWLTGTLSEASAARIERTRKHNERVYDLTVVDAASVMSAARATRNRSLVETLELLFKETPG